MRAFKSAVTQRAGQGLAVANVRVWQGGYYEHVIRDDDEIHRVREYIAGNPGWWLEDEENPANIERETKKTIHKNHKTMGIES